MVGYIKAEEAAKRWDVSLRQVQRMCDEGRIEGVEKFGKSWAIPGNATKPTRTGKLKPGRKPKTNVEEMQ
ncbi:MAG: helix-turn-helix domain-containing protein [Defluviitaleaceae bacterium]|nr:helix-turn-helix domain-containing protein [Defluviitaleaceae bacterium]